MLSAARSPVVGIPSTLIFHSPSSPRPDGRESWNPGSGLPGSLGAWGRMIGSLSGTSQKAEYCSECYPTPDSQPRENPPREFGGMDVELGALLQGECIAWLSVLQLFSPCLPDSCKQRWPRVVTVSRCPHDEICQVASGTWQKCVPGARDGGPHRTHTHTSRLLPGRVPVRRDNGQVPLGSSCACAAIAWAAPIENPGVDQCECRTIIPATGGMAS